MTVVDHATKMVHLIPCRMTRPQQAREATRLYWQHVVKLTRSSLGNPNQIGVPSL